MKIAELPILTPTVCNTKSKGFVLVVDDEEHNRALLRDSLEVRGYEVAEACDGEEAITSVANSTPDVILLDVMMPRQTGFEVCEQLKRDPSTASIPIIMVTALSNREERLMGIKAGANDFLTKPVDLQDLILRVGNAARGKQLFDELQAERERSERLLLNVLPKPVAERMKQGATGIADYFPDVSVLVASLVGFTQIAAQLAPEELVSLLNEIVTTFDVLSGRRKVEKIKTFGDVYMVAGGIHCPCPEHPEVLLQLALEMRKKLEELNGNYGSSFSLRIGISTGPVVAGVIGRPKFTYDLWGETVNTAWQIESGADPGQIMVSENTYERILRKFQFERRDVALAKGDGQIPAYVFIDNF